MTTGTHLIVGAGPVGTALALRLAEAGRSVRIVTRSGGGPVHPGVERRAADATDAEALAAAAGGASVVYNCASPGAYPKWERGWPPLAAAVLHAAETSGAVLVTAGNLYGYGPVDGPITRDLPLAATEHKGRLRARLWNEALEAHQAGRVRATEARASDYIGPTLPAASGALPRYAEATLHGRTATVFGDTDQLHSWSAIDDVAATLVTLGEDERAWGSAWLVPTNPPATIREVLTQLGTAVGVGEPKLRLMPKALLSAAGLLIPMLSEVAGVLYQFDRPFVIDSSETTDVFGLKPTPWAPLIEATARAWLDRR